MHDIDDFECDQEVAVTDRVDPAEEDSYWQRAFGGEHYYRPGFDYEDYAPAYCVGYIGHAQYGGEFEDAEKSLCANWLRIKGDSRLTLEEARPAMRAAWNRMAARGERNRDIQPWTAAVMRLRGRFPSLKLVPSVLR
jgi:hypothetical protein